MLETVRRICTKCAGNIFAGERCPCALRPIRSDKRGTNDPHLNQAHHYHLNKSIVTRSWTKAGVKTFNGHAKKEWLGDGWQISRSRIPRVSAAECSQKNVEWFIFVLETSERCWRNEFDGLMANWLRCWSAGMGQAATNHDLRITHAEGAFLREQICKELRLGPPPRRPWGKRLLRRMKAGVASDRIRRFKAGYKQPQAASFQHISPFQTEGSPIYEGRL
jgi:hypothetical protein